MRVSQRNAVKVLLEQSEEGHSETHSGGSCRRVRAAAAVVDRRSCDVGRKFHQTLRVLRVDVRAPQVFGVFLCKEKIL